MGKGVLSHLKFILSMMVLVVFAGCAGPTTPFGAISIKRLVHSPSEGTDSDDDEGETEVAKRSSTARALTAEPPAVEKVVVLGSQGPSVTAAVPAPATVSTGTVTMTGPVVNREASNSRTLASVSAPAPVSPPINVKFARPHISFTPKRQVLHTGTTFSVMIEDPAGIPSNYEIMLLYNGIDMTNRFLSQADESFEGRPATKLKLSFDHLRMLPNKDNKVEVVYWHGHNDRPVYASFSPPHCSAFKPWKIATTGDFEVPTKLVDTISSTANESHLNPSYIAGLIAQESAFNEKAVSSAKALGLTQITGSGESQVIKGNEGWPRYPNVNRLPTSLVKLKVLAGKINGNNEWRLNPDLSVRGGVNYIAYLNDYWRKPINYGLIANNFRDTDLAITQLILASYNSGPSRVNSALQTHGRRWLRDDEELNEARKYVRRVMSFCDFFSHQEEDTDADSP